MPSLCSRRKTSASIDNDAYIQSVLLLHIHTGEEGSETTPNCVIKKGLNHKIPLFYRANQSKPLLSALVVENSKHLSTHMQSGAGGSTFRTD